MAKKPDDPRQPDSHDKTPKKPHSEAPGEGLPPETRPHPPSDDAIDLGSAGEGVDLSGISVIEWASLVEASQVSSGSQPPSFDSPSDADLIAQLADRKDEPVSPSGPSTMTAPSSDLSALLGETPPITAPPEQHHDADIFSGAPDLPAEDAMFSSRVDLGAPPPSKPGLSAEEDEEVILLGDSGIDLSEAAARPPKSAPPMKKAEDSAIDLSADAFVFEDESSAHVPPVQKEDSAIDLAADAIVEEDVPISHSRGPGDSVIDLSADAIVEEEIVVAKAPPAPGDSALDLSPDAIVEEEVPAPKSSSPFESGIQLSLADIVDEEASAVRSGSPVESGITLTPDSIVGEEGDSAIDLADAGIDIEIAPASAARAAQPKNDSGRGLTAEDIILEETVPSPAGSGSSRDLIAEGLESGVDLQGSKKAAPAEGSGRQKAEEDALDDFLNSVGTEDQSSSVDLGSVHNFPVYKEDKAPAKPASGADSNIRLEDFVGAGADETAGIDLEAADSGAAPARKEAKKQPVGADEDEGIDLDPSAVIAEGEDIEIEAETPAKGKRPADEETILEEEDEVEETSRKKEPEPKRRGSAGAWLGGTVLGAVIGAAACVGVWVFGIEPPKSLREAVGTAEPEKSSPTLPRTGMGPVAPATFDNAIANIKNGDLDKVTAADVDKADKSKADQLVARAEYYWLNYLKKERGKDPAAVLKPDADEVKKALESLNTAIELKSADALYLRGQIHELTGNVAAARKDYEAGKTQFNADPVQRLRFETALQVLDLPKVAHLSPAEMRDLRRMLRGAEHRAVLALLLMAFQPPPGGAPAPAALPDEAGYSFFQALKLARDAEKDPAKWKEALDTLQEARARHEKRRYLLPRKQQNPLSDPREEIFLRAVKELKDYWVMQARLSDYAKLKPEERYASVDALLKATEDTARTALLKDLAKALTKDAKVEKPDDLIKAVNDEQKGCKDKIATLEGTVEDQKKKITTLDENLDKAKKDLIATQDKLVESAVREKALQAANDAANAAFKDMAEVLGVKFADLKTSLPPLLKEVQETKRVANIVDPKGTIRGLEGELALDREKLKQRWEPIQMLDHWLVILQSDRSRSDLRARALQDAGRVLGDADATEVEKGRAQTIRGLVLRNEEKFAEAVPVLSKAKEALTETKGPWLRQAEAALDEVSDPLGHLTRRVDALLARGRQAEALALLNRGLRVTEGKKGALYAKRALLNLEMARARGSVTAANPLMAAAVRDAAEAVKEGLAEGHYATGRIAEERGQFDDAITSYRAAVAAHRTLDDAGSRYRVALARVLVKSRGAETPGIRPLPPRERTGKAPATKGRGVSLASVRSLSAVDFLSLMVLTFQAAELPLAGPKVREAEKLADEILALGNKAPFDARAQALAVKGLYTQAMRAYTTGLRAKGLLAPEYANTLLDLLNNHPVLRRPESLAIPDPTAGERHYAAGLTFFFGRRYADAEKEFLSAVENDNGDARYYYYLGLSRLAQDKQDANEDFDQAARLERLGRPDRAAVSAALERVQGPMRRQLNSIRTRPVRERLK